MDLLLSSISAFATDLKRIQIPHRLLWVSEQIKPLQFVGQAAEFKLSPSSSPCWSSGNHSLRLFEKTIEGFCCKIHGRAVWAAFLQCLGWSDGQAQTQGVSKLVAVAAGLDRLA